MKSPQNFVFYCFLHPIPTWLTIKLFQIYARDTWLDGLAYHKFTFQDLFIMQVYTFMDSCKYDIVLEI